MGIVCCIVDISSWYWYNSIKLSNYQIIKLSNYQIIKLSDYQIIFDDCWGFDEKEKVTKKLILLCGVLGSILGNESYGDVYSMNSGQLNALRSGEVVTLSNNETISDYSKNSIKVRLNGERALRFNSIDDANPHLDIWKLSDCLEIDEAIIKALWLDDFDTLMKMSVYDGFWIALLQPKEYWGIWSEKI